MVVVEEWDDQPTIIVVTCSITRIGPDVMEKGREVDQWIRKKVDPMPSFNPQKEKET